MNRPIYPGRPAPQPQPQPSDTRPPSFYDLRALKQQLDGQLAGLQERLASGEARIEDLIRSQPNPRLAAMGASGIGAAETQQLGEAVVQGRVLPYLFQIDIPYDKNTEGVLEFGQQIITADGPMFVTNILAFAQIDSKDEGAQNFPWSLIKAPSSGADCGSSAYDSADADCDFTLDFGSQLIPGVDARGMFIPLSPAQCRLISPGMVNLCATLSCPDAADRNFQAVVPVTLLDHPECLDGVVSIDSNGCAWQNVQFPLAFLDPGINWDLTNEVPGPLAVGGYMDRNKMIKVELTLTRPSRFNVIVTFMFAGFRLVTCGAGACVTPPSQFTQGGSPAR